jgi:predicted Zn-dependent peptidase
MIPIITNSNKLRIAVDEVPNLETVAIGVFVKTGSRNETLAINGISHFLEHMAFKGTKTRTAKQIAEEFESIGGYINAYTSREKTVYYVKVLKQHACFAIEFLADILQNSVFDPIEVEKERQVILQEVAMTNDTPDDIIFDYFQEQAFNKQPIGRSILGKQSNIKKFNSQHFVDYISSQYNYQNMAIAVAGNVKTDQIANWVDKYFVNFGTNNIKPFEQAKYTGGIIKKAKKLEQVQVVLGFEGLAYTSQKYYAKQILTMILGSGMSSRLFQQIRENLGLAYATYAFNSCYCDSGVLAIYGGTAVDKLSLFLQATKEEISKIQQHISDSEMQKVQTQFLASLAMAKESTNSRMQRIGNDILDYNKIYSDQELIDEFMSINKQAVYDIAQQIFSTKPTLAVLGDIKNSDLSL